MAVSIETLRELLSDARVERVNAVTDLEKIEQQAAAARERVAVLTREEEMLHSMFKRRFPGADDDEHTEDGKRVLLSVHNTELLAMARTAAVEMAIRMLNAAQATVSPGDIEVYLHAGGREDTRDEIGGATAHLNRTNKIHSKGRGQWVYGPDPAKTPGDIVGTTSPGTVPMSGLGGDTDAQPEADPNQLHATERWNAGDRDRGASVAQ